jgi:hypothetical protein
MADTDINPFEKKADVAGDNEIDNLILQLPEGIRDI